MSDPTYVMIFIGLGLALLAATTLPAPARPVRHEVSINMTLLATAVAATALMGALALSHLHVESVICGAIAWLIVMPCLWLARAPQPAEGWGGGDDEDPLPWLDPTGPVGAGVAPAGPPASAVAIAPVPAPAPAGAWAMQPAAAPQPQPFAAQPELVDDAVVAEPAWGAAHRCLPAPAPRERADHRSIAHVHGDVHDTGRRRRASLRRRLLQRCNSWL